MKKVIAIDGNSLLFKAYYATSFTNMMQTSNGVYTNALYSFINMLNKVVNEMEFDYILVAFDASKTTFRNEEFEGYKATRSKAPEELVMQFPLVREYLDIAGIPNYEVNGYEADDIIGTLSHNASIADYQVEIISSDKDLLQLINKNTDVLLAVKGISNLNKISVDNLNTIWDVTPNQVIDLKGLMGDPSDNIPGVKGIGEKTALKLLAEYKSIEGIYKNIDEIKGKVKEKLENDKEMAFQSKKLATIIKDIKLPFEIEDLSIKEIDYSKLKNFYHQYELKSLLNKINKENGFNFVDDFKFEIVEKMSNENLLENSFIDLISLNEYYHKDIIYGLVIINENGNFFINTNNFIKDKNVLSFLKNTNKKVYDLKRNILIAYWHDIEVDNFIDDVLISTYLVDNSIKLEGDALVDTFFNVISMSNKVLLKEDKETIIKEKVKQAYYLNKLVDLNKTKIQETNNEYLYRLELKVARILSMMEEKGILIDTKVLNELNKEYNEIIADLQSKIYKYSMEEFNINSVKQLGDILFEKLNLKAIRKTKTGYSTDNDTLNILIDDHPIIELIIQYRTYTKLLSTYISPMSSFILNDKRVHTIYNQSLTATGRLSSKEPNLQNIATRSDIQKNIKKIFVAQEGYTFISLDYSQIELRILASFSEDETFLDAFRKGFDIHRSTAAKIADIDESKVSDTQRSAAKAINFGIIYGMSDFGLARQLKITRNEAKEFIDKYYKTYSKIKDYINKQVEQVEILGYSKTVLNRIRYINEIRSNNHNIKETGKRMAMNSPIQGSAADILKLAMVEVQKIIDKKEFDAYLLLQVHDELIFEVKDEDVEKILPLLVEAMENAYQLLVPLTIHSSVGKSWYEL